VFPARNRLTGPVVESSIASNPLDFTTRAAQPAQPRSTGSAYALSRACPLLLHDDASVRAASLLAGNGRPFSRRRHALPLIDPLRRPPKGLAPFWTRARRLLWSWWPWVARALFLRGATRMVVGLRSRNDGSVSYLIAPVESPTTIWTRS
jgi:hypothetical protein